MAGADTAAKRRSVLKAGLPVFPTIPSPTGAVSKPDRKQAVYQYIGIESGLAEVTAVTGQTRIGGGGWNGGMADYVVVQFECLREWWRWLPGLGERGIKSYVE